MAARLKVDALHVEGPDRWFVTDGLNAVGPVRRDLLVRGIEAGRVPLESFVRHDTWKVWRPLADFAEPSAPGLSKSLSKPGEPPPSTLPLSSLLEEPPASGEEDDLLRDEKSNEISDRPTMELFDAAVRSAAGIPDVSPPEAAESHEGPTQVSRDLLGGDRPTLASYLDDDEETNVPTKTGKARPAGAPSTSPPPTSAPPASAAPMSASRARARESVAPNSTRDELAGASDLSEVLLLLLNGVVRRTSSTLAILHRMADDGATAVCAHGPNLVELLGTRTRLLDPAVVAAAGGNVVVAEPAPGPAGEATLQRLRKSGLDTEGAAMFPIRPKNRLLAMIEIGREAPFKMEDLARAEDLIASFVRRAESGEWA